ncbi:MULTISPECIES: pseudouridine synthase [unclassified Devosia]|uniref:pseudouridine synthase n=1 Tax=unclassified Devosia TaxID=196773 RepID=UPI00145D8BEF|nr:MULTISPECIES: pseudouridine synthase [unclassified Devosia]MBJ6985877.1 pseudouridine synthase [Devosia sp. MC521]QMW61254.1 pseudouridine synthase [Devosia sp. MC521]
MARLILLNKPYGVLTQFTNGDGEQTLSDFVDVPDVYAAGRLDKDSEGLLILTDSGTMHAQISSPKFKKEKTYLVQVEGNPSDDVLRKLARGVELNDGKTRPAKVERIDPPELWERNPPVRFRKSVPDTWLKLTITEGRNRQVRRMTAAIGFPTLRLVRWAIGDWTVDGLAPGEWRDAPMPEGFVERERAPRTEGAGRPAGGGFKRPEGRKFEGKKPARAGGARFDDGEAKRPTGGARALQDKRNSPTRLAERRAEGSRRAERLAAGKVGKGGGKLGFKGAGKPAGKPSAGRGAAGKPVGGKPTAGRPTSGRPTPGKPAARPGADRRGGPSQPRPPKR